MVRPFLLLIVAFAGPAAAQFVDTDLQAANIAADVRSQVVLNAGNVGTRNQVFVQGGAAGWGGYLTVPLITTTDPARIEAGNLELGALYEFSGPLMSLLLKVGGTLPTSATSDQAFVAAKKVRWARISDFATSVPGFAALRLSGSTLVPAGILYIRGDIGFDLLIPLVSDNEVSTSFRANLGLGFRYSLFGASLDYATQVPVNKGTVDYSDGLFNHSLGFYLRVRTRWIQPWLGFSAPLNEKDIYTFSVGLSTRFFWKQDRLAVEEPWP
jgi:hypothetical protein